MAECNHEVIPICRVRGDTYPIQFALKDTSGGAINITGFTFLLTVDPSDAPVDAVNNLFQLTGVIDDGAGGLMSMTLSTGDADQTPGDFFYDLEQTDTGGAIRTISNGGWQVIQDITK